jgi:hypothetical protein
MGLFSRSEVNNNPVDETPQSILFVEQPPQGEQDLLAYIQCSAPDPLDILLNGEAVSSQFMLGAAAPASRPESTELKSPEASSASPSVMIEQGVPLSQCKLWEMLLHYYASQGINAWHNSVPNFITSSVYMAESYAECIVAFLTDYLDRIDLREPVYIVEMATGTGRFSFHLLQELERKLFCFSRFEKLKIRYVMTDFTESNPEFWEANGRLKPYMDCGVLDFAVFNPLEDQSFTLRLSGQRVDCKRVKNPVIAIANYFFDSTPVDVFYIQDQQLKEGLVSLERSLDGVEPDSEPHISQITSHFEFRDLPHHRYYADDELNAVLNQYRLNVQDGQILFPLGAFQIVRNLRKLSNNRLVLLSSDKGYTNPAPMLSVGKHEFAIHDGTFSFMVNYDALGNYFHSMGGKYFATTAENLSVQTVCLISGMTRGNRDYEHVRYVFREKIDRQNPANSLCAMLPGREHSENPVLRLNYYLAQMRMHMADPFIFSELAQPLTLAASGQIWASQRKELLRLLDLAMENYYYSPGECDLPSLVAPLYLMLGCAEQSLFCLQVSEMLFGEAAPTHFLMGHCHDQMGLPNEALAHFEAALAIHPEFPEAQVALAELKARMGIA